MIHVPSNASPETMRDLAAVAARFAFWHSEAGLPAAVWHALRQQRWTPSIAKVTRNRIDATAPDAADLAVLEAVVAFGERDPSRLRRHALASMMFARRAVIDGAPPEARTQFEACLAEVLVRRRKAAVTNRATYTSHLRIRSI